MSAGTRIRGLTRQFDPARPPVLDHIDLDIAPGEFVALLGASGSGKTTLLRTLAGLDPAPADAVVDVPQPAAVVFQQPLLLPWKSVWQNVALGLEGGDTRPRAEAALREVGLGHRTDVWPGTLSGGEAQRAALARALVRAPALLLLDEPFAALDALTRLKMHDLVLDLWEQHRPATLLVTHDVDEAVALADRLLVLAHGRIALDCPTRRPARATAATRRSPRCACGCSSNSASIDAPPDPAAGDFPMTSTSTLTRRGLVAATAGLLALPAIAALRRPCASATRRTARS